MFPPDLGIDDMAQELDLIERQGFVKVTQSANGTEIKWSVFAPNWASLYFALEWIDTFPAPYTLNYNLAGWFEEHVGAKPAHAIASRSSSARATSISRGAPLCRRPIRAGQTFPIC